MATFTVTNTNDSGAGSLRAAVLAANAAAGEDTIAFAATFDGGAEDLIRLTSGEIEITDALKIVGGPAGVTITGDRNGDDVTSQGGITDVAASLAGDDRLDDNSRIFHETSGAAVELEGLTLTGGCNSADGLSGGGVLGTGSIALTDCTVVGNSTRGEGAGGGGIAGNDVTVASSRIIENQTRSGDSYNPDGSGGGGGVKGTNVRITDSIVSGNYTRGDFADGGGVLGNTVHIANSAISQNTTRSYKGDGGGVAGKVVTLSDSIISENQTFGEDSHGAGVNSRKITLIRSTVDGNITWGDRSVGAGIDGDFVDVFDSTISNNEVDYRGYSGGGITGANINLINSTVYGNKASDGAGIYGGNIIIYNSTITANSGEAIRFIGSELKLVNSILSGNPGDIGSSGGSVTIESSMVGPDGRSVFASTTEIAPGVFAGMLADNGGPTKTVALRLDPSNPAIGGADPATATATDQRGVPRDAEPDIGAFEAPPLGGLTIIGGPKADVLSGTVFADRICGGAGSDTLRGLAGDDLLKGGSGCDTLKGQGGRDALFGGWGVDRLNGGTGSDELWGGRGADVFVFGPAFGCDRIGDFDANPTCGQDRIDLRGLGVTASSFDETVMITEIGSSTRITVEHQGVILCTGVTGDGANVIDQDDFLL